MQVRFDAMRLSARLAVISAILLTFLIPAVAGDAPPVCRGTPDPGAPLEIECIGEDDVGFSGVQLSPGSVNLSLGGGGFQSVTLPIVVRPTDADLDAGGGVVFTENAAVPQQCEVNTLFLQDRTTLCLDSGITVSLADSEYMAGRCDISGVPCNDENDCPIPMAETCLRICHGDGAFDDIPCIDDIDCGSGRCAPRTAECSLNLPDPLEPEMPPGYVQSPFCRIMTVRVREQGQDTTVDLVKDNGYDPSLRLMFAESSGGVFPPYFKDVTIEVEQVCGGGSGSSGFQGNPSDFGTRDKGCGDLGGGITFGPGSSFPPQVKLTCANFVGYAAVDCQDVANQNRDEDNDCFPVCAGDVLAGCGGVNPGNLADCNDFNADINPNASEVCNGLDDDCNSVCIGGDNNGELCASDDFCFPGGGFCNLLIDDGFNFDGDFLADCFDCQVPDPDAWKEPSAEVTGVRLTHSGGPGGTTTIEWDPLDPACAGGTTYDTISSVTPEFSTQSCVRNFGTGAFCSSDPASGQVFYYAVRAGNPCGDGPLGAATDGTPRPAPPGPGCLLGGESCP